MGAPGSGFVWPRPSTIWPGKRPAEPAFTRRQARTSLAVSVTSRQSQQGSEASRKTGRVVPFGAPKGALWYLAVPGCTAVDSVEVIVAIASSLRDGRFVTGSG